MDSATGTGEGLPSLSACLPLRACLCMSPCVSVGRSCVCVCVRAVSVCVCVCVDHLYLRCEVMAEHSLILLKAVH